MGRAVEARGDGREALLDATVRVVARKGLRGLTFRAVADQAKVNNSLIAYHFGSRDNLLAAALVWSAERARDVLDLSEYFSDSEAFGEALVEYALSDSHIELFQYEMTLEANRRPELQSAVREQYMRYVGQMRKSQDASGSDPALNLALFAALDGLVLAYLGGTITTSELTSAINALSNAIATA